MYRNKLIAAVALVLTGTIVACSKTSPTPVSPSSVAPTSANADDPVTLKATAPTLNSPANEARLEAAPVLQWSAATLKNSSDTLSHRVQVLNAAGVVVVETVVNGTSFTVPEANLDFETRYTWRVRGELQGANGPFSAASAFVTAAGAYLRGNEIRDPLTSGKTVAGLVVDATFIPGQGIRLNGRESYVEYKLERPLENGEFSAIMTNVGNGSEEWKTKVMSMLQGDGVNVTDNAFRVTLDKRTLWLNQGAPARYTMRSRGTDAGEPNAGPQSWNRSALYLWRFTWNNGQSRMSIRDGGVNGFVKVDIGVPYRAPYAPNPHLVRLGSVMGRGGSDTNPNTIIRNVWVSGNPRPNFPGDTP